MKSISKIIIIAILFMFSGQLAYSNNDITSKISHSENSELHVKKELGLVTANDFNRDFNRVFDCTIEFDVEIDGVKYKGTVTIKGKSCIELLKESTK